MISVFQSRRLLLSRRQRKRRGIKSRSDFIVPFSSSKKTGVSLNLWFHDRRLQLVSNSRGLCRGGSCLWQSLLRTERSTAVALSLCAHAARGQFAGCPLCRSPQSDAFLQPYIKTEISKKIVDFSSICFFFFRIELSRLINNLYLFITFSFLSSSCF